MIIRILGEGQYDVPDGVLDGLNDLDTRLEQALDSGDEPTFRQSLATLLQRVREEGSRLPDDSLEPSDAILPDEEAHVDDVRELLGEEGLIPG